MNSSGISFSLGAYHSALENALETIRRDNIIARIWAGDHTVWKPAPDEIINRLGWLDAPAETINKLPVIKSALQPLIRGTIKDTVLLGMGGSSLAAEVFNKVIGCGTGYPVLHILDTIDPAVISKITRKLDWGKTLFLVSSKSGTTLEITSLFQYFYNLALKMLGVSAKDHFIFITDEGSTMAKQAKMLSLRYLFLSNPDIGGRYSALSLPGIVPAVIIGADGKKLLQNALAAAQREKAEFFSGDMEGATGCVLGAVLGILATKGRDKLTLIMPSRWRSFGDWLEQLIAESTGKEGKGILPVLNEPYAQAHTYSEDRVFVVFQSEQEKDHTEIEALIKADHPVITIHINDDYELGSQMFIWEMATAVTSHFLGVNPFDQPDVEATKKHTRSMITEYKKKKSMSVQKPSLSTDEGDLYGSVKDATVGSAINNFLKQAKAGDYICLQVYLSPSPEIDEALAELRKTIFLKYRLPVTLGYGPRYLHSTGQLHKGDSGRGLFIQLTADEMIDVDIPDEIGKIDSSLTFGALKAAQAQGDWQALTDKGRRIIRLHCKKDAVVVLKNLILSL